MNSHFLPFIFSALALAAAFALILPGSLPAEKTELVEDSNPAPATVPAGEEDANAPDTQDATDGAPKAGGVTDPVARIRQIEGDEFALDEIRFNRATREIRFPAKVNMTRDQIEYIIVTETGKTHESLLSTKTSPFILNVVMLLCRYEASAQGLIEFVEREGPDGPGGAAPPADQKPDGTHPFAEENADKKSTPPATESAESEPAPGPAEKKPVNNLLEILVRYEKDGKQVEALIDDWIYNSVTKTSLGDKFWVYTGSDISNGDFIAELEGSIVAIYLDRYAMFNNPIKGADNDEIWEPFGKNMPVEDTPVEVIFRPVKAEPDK